MDTEQEISTPMRKKYSVVSVEKADPPEGLQAGNWHHYVIGQGSQKIEGYRTGSLKAVTEHAETIASDLNERASSSKSTYAVSKKK